VKIGIVVPGGVDRSGRERVIPAILWFIERIARVHETHVFALSHESKPGRWTLLGAVVHNAGSKAAVARTVQAIVREHGRGGFHLLHAFWAVPPGLAALLAARVIRRPIMVHAAGGETADLPAIGYGGSRTARGRWLLRRVLRSAAAVTAASAPIVRALANLGVEADRVPLGVDVGKWPPAPPRPRGAHEPARLVHVASLNAVKDQRTLVRALAQLTADGVAFSIDIIGEDTTGGEIAGLARKVGVLDRCTFHGWLPHVELRPFFDTAHLHVMSSLHEAGPLALLEAAVAGVPTVGTAVGHIGEFAPDAASAVAPGDPAALAAAMRALLDDDARRLRVAAEAQRRALEDDADETARSFLALYDRITAVHPRTRVRV